MNAIEKITASRWSNWSGSVTSDARFIRPRSLDALCDAVRRASAVRATGAGHSFMPLCASDGLIVSVEDLPGEIRLDAGRRTARVPAGWSLHYLTAELGKLGFALANQGDVDPQSLAGAMATGTHGTGETLGSLSTFARGFRLVGADGELRWCDADTNPDLFQAQRLSLGLFGIAIEIEVAVVPAFHLVERITKMRWAEVRERFDSLAAEHRHAEFFIFPHADSVILKTLSLTDPCEPPPTTSDMEEAGFQRLLDIGVHLPMAVPLLQKLVMRGRFDAERRGPAHSIFPSDRGIRFEEMEYELPRAAGFEALSEMLDWIRRRRLPVSFPFEYRVVAGDDIWMSPMNRGPVASLSMHQYVRQPWREIFAEGEAIFRAHGGRPHWAKRHTLTRADVDSLYPMAEHFRAVRRHADPQGKFLNPHLEGLFS
ncbi:D-arabinono-1,4-lactone oxidase [Sandaracinobacteroides saxicola]|uniref:FAD-binding protein n=1 Tax=Sandaracinobacteroides saxicola TaxID=2759707 RepID=A0A7G5ILE1_9SPHN|nr:D-arabinono-1,4-lactone oxidase [Sandaracinobacteroides saxicola]QMW24183.1 FAD-binding protein [Sandaracinobacteroides saxicola]